MTGWPAREAEPSGGGSSQTPAVAKPDYASGAETKPLTPLERELLEALKLAREIVAEDHQSLIDSCSVGGEIDPLYAPFIAEFGDKLARIDAALAKAGSHTENGLPALKTYAPERISAGYAVGRIAATTPDATLDVEAAHQRVATAFPKVLERLAGEDEGRLSRAGQSDGARDAIRRKCTERERGCAHDSPQTIGGAVVDNPEPISEGRAMTYDPFWCDHCDGEYEHALGCPGRLPQPPESAPLAHTQHSEGGWRTIESAPKDGSWVMLYSARWPIWAYPMVGWSDGPGEEWQFPEHPQWAADMPWPTHWMPLPQPPQDHGHD